MANAVQAMTLSAFRRAFSTTALRLKGPGALHGDAAWQKWKKITFLVAMPAIVLAHINVFGFADPESHERPEFVAYDYLRLRKKRFPWGDGNHSFIHNPHMNALPDGYEEEDH